MFIFLREALLLCEKDNQIILLGQNRFRPWFLGNGFIFQTSERFNDDSFFNTKFFVLLAKRTEWKG